MKVLVVSIGSAGDVHPSVAVAQFDAFTANPALWRHLRGMGVIARMVDLVTSDIYRLIEQQTTGRDTVVVAHPLAFGARLAQEKLGVPLATLHLAPSTLRTRRSPARGRSTSEQANATTCRWTSVRAQPGGPPANKRWLWNPVRSAGRRDRQASLRGRGVQPRVVRHESFESIQRQRRGEVHGVEASQRFRWESGRGAQDRLVQGHQGDTLENLFRM